MDTAGEIRGYKMTDDEFKILRDLVHKESGIYLNESKKSFLMSRVDKRLKLLNMNSYFQYYKYITGANGDELREFIDSVTINETYFFRNIPQFEMFREKVLPEVDRKKTRSQGLQSCNLERRLLQQARRPIQ